MALMLSLIMQKAAFNFRGTGKWYVEAAQLKKLAIETGLTDKTITNNLKVLVELGLIDSRQYVREPHFKSRPQRFGFAIAQALSAAYMEIVHVVISKRVQNIMTKASKLFKPAGSKIQKLYRRQGKYQCALPSIEAERPCFAARSRVPISDSPHFAYSGAGMEKSGQPYGNLWF